MKFLKNLLFTYCLKRVIKKANKYAVLTNCKFYVLFFKGRLRIFKKQDIKLLIAMRRLRGPIQEIEKIALHITM